MAKPARPYTPEPPAETQPGPSYCDCPFRCNAPYRRAVKAYEKAYTDWEKSGYQGDQPWPVELEPRAGQPVYCLRCAVTIRAALRELPLAYDAVGPGAVLVSTMNDDEHVARTAALPSPSPGADQQDEIAATMRDWEDMLRRYLGHKAATDVFDDRRATLANSIEYLNTHFRQIITWADDPVVFMAADFGGDVWRLHSSTTRMVKSGPMRRHLPVPCPTCQARTLIQEEGKALEPWSIECVERIGGCGRVFSENEYAWLRELILDKSVSMPGRVAA